MDAGTRRRAAEALRAIKRGGEGWFSLSEAVMGRPAPRDEVVARLADLIDPGEDTTVDAYDLLPVEDREALRWVHGHGGLETVEARLMPEGMEWLVEVWPKWSNGEYCKFGDWWTADKYGDYEPKQLRRLVFYTPEQLREWEQDEGDNFGYEWDFMRPSDTTYRPDKAEPPAPKVIDADGAETRVGDTVWDVISGIEFTVDGLPRSGEYQSVKLRLDNGAVTGLDPDRLTHQRPIADTWERLEEDCAKSDVDYCAERGLLDPSCDTVEGEGSTRHCADCGCTCGEKMARDLVRRCRALAERERGE